MTIFSALGIMMSSQLGNVDATGAKRKTVMILVLILSSIFFAGFLVGYGARSWRSHKRREHYLKYAPYESRAQSSTFGHARRAF
jgi:hypothetical protein